MIRFIDLRHHEEDIGDRFAFWNTVTDRFISDDMDRQAWTTIEDSRDAELKRPAEGVPGATT